MIAFQADLFEHVERYCGANYSTCPIQLNGNLHFSTAWSPPYSTDSATKQPLQKTPEPSGQQYTGLLVAQVVQRVLPASKIQPPINMTHTQQHDEDRDLLKGGSGGNLGAELGVAGAGTVSSCGLPPLPLNKSLPNVLIIGDSVSDSGSGYGPLARELLETSTGNGNTVGNNPRNNGPLASVQHNGGWSCVTAPSPVFPDCRKGANEQAGPTTNGVQCIDTWLGQSSTNYNIAPPFLKWHQKPDLICGLRPAPMGAGGKTRLKSRTTVFFLTFISFIFILCD